MNDDYDELFRILYDRYYDGIYRYIFANVKNKWNAEDIVSVVFTKLYINREKITDVEGSKNWIYRIARNAIIDYYRANNKVIPINYILDSSNFEEGYDNILIQEEFEEVFKIIDELPNETKNFLKLRYFEGLKFREISEATNTSESTVKTTVSRAIKRVKKIYENNSIEDEISL